MAPSVSTKEFSILDEFIHTGKKPRKIVHRYIINNKKQSIYAKVPTRQIVEHYLQEIEIWAQQQDIEAGLQKYCAIPFDTKGIYPLYHLAALAVTGQIAQLEEYINNFKKGNKITFSNYIKQDFIKRALEAAKKNT